MKKVDFYTIPPGEKVKIFEQVSELTGLPPFAVEKDWWVVKALELIFGMEIKDHLLFKGGTSLNKAWSLISRFSEDIDLALDRNFFCFPGELPKKEITRMRIRFNEYINSVFFPDLVTTFRDNGFVDVNFNLVKPVDSDQDPRVIEISYPNLTESTGYIQQKIQLEIGCRSLREPFSLQSISSFVDASFPESAYAASPVAIPTVNPERTLLEKIFLLHEEFQRPVEKIRVDRMSRHLYDIYVLVGTPFALEALSNKELYAEIVHHRQKYTRLGGVNYKLHNPKNINPLPPSGTNELWKQDFLRMKEQMIYGDSPTYEEMVDAIRIFLLKLNALDWEVS